jgi:hypothetical protein
MEKSEIITQREAMKMLRDMGYIGIAHAQIKFAAENGGFQTYRPGKRIFYIKSSVLAWAQKFTRR